MVLSRQLRDLLLARRHLFSWSKLLRETALTVLRPFGSCMAASLPRLLKEGWKDQKKNGVCLLLLVLRAFRQGRVGGLHL